MSNCDIVKDLIPLYAENIASDESRKLVKNHCAECSDCNTFLKLAQKEINTNFDKKEIRDKIWKNLKRQKKIRVIKTILITILICVVLFTGIRLLDSCVQQSGHGNSLEAYYGKEIYSELKEGCSEKDRKELEPLMKKIERAIKYVGNYKSAKKKFGKTLSSLSYGEDDIVITEAEVKLLTAKLYHDIGYMWIEYSRYGYEGGKMGDDIGSCQIEVRLSLVKDPYGDWKAVQLREAP